jgi:hypothetical protein
MDGTTMPRTAEGKPFVPPQMPNHDDTELGFSFFRQLLQDADYSNLTLPRTYFGRPGLLGEDKVAIWCMRYNLTDEQRAVMEWSADSGEEPPGG